MNDYLVSWTGLCHPQRTGIPVLVKRQYSVHADYHHIMNRLDRHSMSSLDSNAPLNRE